MDETDTDLKGLKDPNSHCIRLLANALSVEWKLRVILFFFLIFDGGCPDPLRVFYFMTEGVSARIIFTGLGKTR